MPVPISSVLTLGPLTCQSLQGSKFQQPPTPTTAVTLQSPQSMECRICSGHHHLFINTLAGAEAPRKVVLSFHSAKKGTTFFPP